MKWMLLAHTLIVLNGCAAVPAIPSIAGFVGSGGVTLYKKATESGPKAEFVLVKFEIHHDVITQK
jgi:hypothetical protein